MSHRFSSVTILLWTEGAETLKYHPSDRELLAQMGGGAFFAHSRQIPI